MGAPSGTPTPYRVLDRKRAGARLSAEEIGAVVAGSVDGTWSEAQLAAFLTSTAIHGLDASETRALTAAMLQSGEAWQLGSEFPGLCDKHSTGGVGDKVSLVLAPLLAACGVPVIMLTGRGLGHTGGTADKLESIPGVELGLDRDEARRSLERIGIAIGVANEAIAPADRVLYRLRDQTATVDSTPLITASILSKKLAAGAGGLVLDVKTGSGAFTVEMERAEELAETMVETARELGCATAALITDMNQPLGRTAGHAAEVREAIECLSDEGSEDVVALTIELALQAAEVAGVELERKDLQEAMASGRALELLDRWVVERGGASNWIEDDEWSKVPAEVCAVTATREGFVTTIDTRELGLLLIEAGGGRVRAGDEIDSGVTLRTVARLGDRIDVGDELARLHLRRHDPRLSERLAGCFEIGPEPIDASPLVRRRIGQD